MASTRPDLEQRLADLEAEMHNLKCKVDKLERAEPWWQQITGTFEDDPIYDAAMKRGRQYRESLRPKSSTRGQK